MKLHQVRSENLTRILFSKGTIYTGKIYVIIPVHQINKYKWLQKWYGIFPMKLILFTKTILSFWNMNKIRRGYFLIKHLFLVIKFKWHRLRSGRLPTFKNMHKHVLLTFLIKIFIGLKSHCIFKFKTDIKFGLRIKL